MPSVTTKLSLLGFDGSGYDESGGDFSYGGLEPDPTAGDLGTLPDPMTTLPVVDTGAVSEDFGGTSAFITAGSDNFSVVPNPQDVGTINTQIGQDTGGGVDPTKDTTSSNSGIGGLFSDAFGAINDLLNGTSSVLANRGIGSATPASGVSAASPSAPVKNNPLTKPAGFIDINENSGLPFLVVFGVLLFVLWRKG